MFLCCRVITVCFQQAGKVCDNLAPVSVTDSHRWDAVSAGGNGYLTGAGVDPGVTTGNHPNPKQSCEGNHSTDNTCSQGCIFTANETLEICLDISRLQHHVYNTKSLLLQRSKISFLTFYPSPLYFLSILNI